LGRKEPRRYAGEVSVGKKRRTETVDDGKDYDEGEEGGE